MSNRIAPKRGRFVAKRNFKVIGDHEEFLSRINKTLYYGQLPKTERFSLPVSELAAELFSEEKYGRSLDRLRLEEAASMSKNACVSPCSLVLALVYLERLKLSNTEYVCQVPPSELFLVTMMVASKFLYDDGEEDEVFNDEWAASAGIDVKEINQFERDFLKAIDWKVFVTENNFWKRLWSLEKDIALREGKRRGWFSYTDMDRLIESVDVAGVVNAILTVSAVCLTSYTVSVLTLLGSAFVVSQIPGNAISQVTRELSQPAIEVPRTTTARDEQQVINELMTSLMLTSFESIDNDVNATDFQQLNSHDTVFNLPSLSTETFEDNATVCPGVDNFDEQIYWKLVASLVDWIWKCSWLQSSDLKVSNRFDLLSMQKNYSTVNWVTFIAPWSLHMPYHMTKVPPIEIISHWQ